MAGDLDTETDEVRERFLKHRISSELASDLVAWKKEIEDASGKHLGGDVVAKFVRRMLEPGNITLRVIAYSFAFGLNRMHGWKSLREAAREFGYTVAALSKEQIRIREQYGLPHNEHSKAAEVCDSYRRSQLAKNWRHSRLCK